MLKPDERELLGRIESTLRELTELQAQHSTTKKRCISAKTDKVRAAAQAKASLLGKDIQAKEAFVRDATERLFKSALDIEEHGVAALVDSDGKQKDAVVVHMMRVRQLSDGSAVFSVSGDVFDEKREVKTLLVPTNVMLMAAESKGERLVSLT